MEKRKAAAGEFSAKDSSVPEVSRAEKDGRAEIESAEPMTKLLCFVVAPIGAAESEERKRSDQVLRHLIKRALEPEYFVERADHIDRPGIITVQIVQRIFDADLVVADLTARNPNVYYELAIRHAAWKPAIHIISRGQDIPFDVQDMRVVPYDLADPDSLEAARSKLREYANAIQKGEPVITPVQIAQILRSFEAGETRDAQLRALFESLNVGISNLQEGIAEIVQDVRSNNMSNNMMKLWSSGTPTGTTNLADLALTRASGFSFPSKVFRPIYVTTSQQEAKAKAIKKAKEEKDKK